MTSNNEPERNEITDRMIRKSIVGDEPCSSGIYARIPAPMRDKLHAAAKQRGIGLNTLCLLAFVKILADEPQLQK